MNWTEPLRVEDLFGIDETRGGYDAVLARIRLALRNAAWAQAEALLMRAAAFAADDPAYLNLAGLLWEARGNDRLARHFYGRAIHADPAYEPAQQNMRRLYELRTFGRTIQPPALGHAQRADARPRGP
jgi:Flp pilus assembly protein TadD